MRSPRRLAAVAVLLATALAGTPALVTSADAAPDRSDRPSDRAVARAADRYGISPSGLEARLRADSSLRLTPSGAAFFVDPAPTSAPEPARTVAQAFPLPDTFKLHSKPDSQRTIYLDFNGHTVSNTLWNDAPNNVPNGLAHPPMDLGSNGPSFSELELIQIQDIYQRVAEDYAPFDVDVTTEEPTAAELDRSGAGDAVYGTRALISPSGTALNSICGGSCGGVAFIGVFNHYKGKDNFVETHGQLQPAWIFPQSLGNDPKNIAEATTHEVGHNLGLDHDGLTDQGYYAGHDMWAPIMGTGYDRPVSQFALSDYHANADLGGGTESLQESPDDLATITSFGTPYRSDEAGSSVATAAAVPTGSAYIHSRTDVDVFNLGTCSGNVTVNALGADVSPNLDIELQLLGPGGANMLTDNPPSSFVNRDIAGGMDATVSALSVPSGQYYARVDGAGRGSAAVSYTDYGSIGAYRLTVTGCGGPVTTVPSAPLSLAGTYLGENAVQLTWAAPASDGGTPLTSYNVYEDGVLIGTSGADSTGGVVADVTPGVHTYGVAAVNGKGEGPRASVVVDARDTAAQAKPGKARIGTAKPGSKGGKLTATVSWQPPTVAPNPAISGWEAVAYKKNKKGKYVKVLSQAFPASTGGMKFTTNRRGSYKFAVRARNALGYGPLSALSNAVSPR